MIVSYSLHGITRAGSKGMISARNIKAPHFRMYVFETLKKCKSSEPFRKSKKKEKQPWKRAEFLSGDKDR